MKKEFDLWVDSRPFLRKFIMKLKIALFILVVGVSTTLAATGYSQVTNDFPANDILSNTEIKSEVQQNTISGTVTDAVTKEPMPGVNVLIKGTTIGTLTGADGKYTLPVPDPNSAILVFSFIGYTTKEVAISGKTVIDLVLESAMTGLDEVVVVGYG